MSEPTWPAFMLDGHDVAVVTNASDVERELEPFLATQPVEFYDACARQLRMVVEPRANKQRLFRLIDRPSIRLDVISTEVHEERLRGALTRYLRAVGRAAPDESDLQTFATAAANLIR
jgi:hypothetical protein